MSASRNLTPFRVFVASPGDLTAERQRIKELEKDLRDDAEHAGYALRISDWHDLSPGAGRPQGVIFSQLPPDDWDVFIGMLWQRFGTSSGTSHPGTGTAFESGTEEEFYHAFKVNRENGGWPAVLTYRCMRAILPTANFKQLGAVQEFFEEFDAGKEHEALIGVFDSAEDLVRKVSKDLRRLFHERKTSTPDPSDATSKRSPVSADSLDIPAYREHIRRHYRHLQLEALGGDTFYRDIELQQVFVPQDVRDCGAWLPADLEGPAELTLQDADFALAELHGQQQFRGARRRNIFTAMEDPLGPGHHLGAKGRVLLGAPGAGKSSFTRICLLRWLEEKSDAPLPLPVLIELRRFHRSGSHDFLDYLATDKDLVFRFPRAALEARLRDGTAELLFDGLHEIFDLEERDTVTRLIARCAETYPQARILVTSRHIGYDGRVLRAIGFAHWLLADFDEEKIARFLQHWIYDAIREPGDRPIVRRRLEEALKNKVIRELAGNPLLLTLMAVLARESDLPRDLGSLYRQAADLLLKQWDARRYLATHLELGGSIIIDQKDKHDLLRDLAWRMQTSGDKRLRGNLISADEVRAAMDAAFASRIADAGLRRQAIERLLDQLIERNYILCHVGGAQFAFVHRGFLEFFASEHLVNLVATQPGTAVEEIGRIYSAHAKDDAWQEVLILAATRFIPALADQILLPLVTAADRNDVEGALIGGIPHPFVLGCTVLMRSREPAKLTRTAAEARNALETWIREQPDDVGVQKWLEFLANALPDDPTRALLTELARGDTEIFARGGAVASLAEHFRDDGTRALLTELARRDENTTARKQAVESLAVHFSNAPATAEALQNVTANERGRQFVSDVASQSWRSEAAREYLQSFLRDPASAEQSAGG